MKEKAYNFLLNKEKETFFNIFNYVENECRDFWLKRWKKNFKEIKRAKLGELYVLLTIDGDFKQLLSGDWILSKYVD